ncbi:hypothetical protein PCASD_10698 [Puccinia coronata f. sp. avenae]|uniref:Uncharacterized protein n=1 Tax=Puccinia coronata f. sp. avenae TaxID=200324 RepID=A0A2N5UQ68_9BASI|nr:hypothetical protein PCASD_10698 [Puccinia coronata f. sp. avenae]
MSVSGKAHASGGLAMLRQEDCIRHGAGVGDCSYLCFLCFGDREVMAGRLAAAILSSGLWH